MSTLQYVHISKSQYFTGKLQLASLMFKFTMIFSLSLEQLNKSSLTFSLKHWEHRSCYILITSSYYVWFYIKKVAHRYPLYSTYSVHLFYICYVPKTLIIHSLQLTLQVWKPLDLKPLYLWCAQPFKRAVLWWSRC